MGGLKRIFIFLIDCMMIATDLIAHNPVSGPLMDAAKNDASEATLTDSEAGGELIKITEGELIKITDAITTNVAVPIVNFFQQLIQSFDQRHTENRA